MTEDFCHLLEEADIADDIHDVILQVNPKLPYLNFPGVSILKEISIKH